MPFTQAFLEPAASSVTLAADPIPVGYKPCDCLGRSPIRGCRICFSTHWLKRCQDCCGEGTLTKQARQTSAQGRTERCGRCMGVGWTPCPMAEVHLAEEETGLTASPSSIAPAPAATTKRIQVRRAQVKKSRKSPVRKSVSGQTVITAERPQNPLEAMEIYEEGDQPAQESQEPQQSQEAREVEPSSFGPSDDVA